MTDGEFWSEYHRKEELYRRIGDERRLGTLEWIRSWACGDILSTGCVEANTKLILRTFDVSWSPDREIALKIQWFRIAEDEYNGADEGELWWRGEDVVVRDENGEITAAYGVLPSEKFYRKPVVYL